MSHTNFSHQLKPFSKPHAHPVVSCAETEKAQAAFGGSVTLTYAELEAVLQNCRWGVESAPGEDPPAGYEALPPEQAEIADACWNRGQQQLSTALLNYWYDHGAAPVSPNKKVSDAR